MRFPTITTWSGIWIGISRFDYSSMIQYPKIRKNIEGYYSMNIYEKIFARLEELHISPIELFKDPDLETKRRLLRYFELIEICRGINQENESKNIKRNVSVIQDVDGNNIVMINDIAI